MRFEPNQRKDNGTLAQGSREPVLYRFRVLRVAALLLS